MLKYFILVVDKNISIFFNWPWVMWLINILQKCARLPVFPGYSQDTEDISQVEGVESSLLSDIRSPCLAVVQQCAEDRCCRSSSLFSLSA